MTRSLGNVIADSLQLSLSYADRLLQDVDSSQFGRFAAPGGQAVNSNHPAFVFSHLAIYPPRILDQLQRGDLQVLVPDQIQSSGSKDATCVDDPEGTIYASRDEIIQVFQQGYAHVAQALREASGEILQQPNPAGGRMTELFPTIGSMHGFYVGGHMMMHLGQVSAWRRMQGMAPA